MKWFKKYRILSSWKEGQCTVRMRRLLGDDRKYLLGLQFGLLEYELFFFFYCLGSAQDAQNICREVQEINAMEQV